MLVDRIDPCTACRTEKLTIFDYAALAGTAQMRQRQAREARDAHEAEIERVLPRGVVERVERAKWRPPRVVHENIERAETGDGIGNRMRCVVWTTHVHRDRVRVCVRHGRFA